jgi:gliding motility-associated-like protein
MLHLLAPLYALFALTGLFPDSLNRDNASVGKPAVPFLVDCNCSITQGTSTYPVSALLGNQSASAFYSYGSPLVSSANTGLELSNGLILFLYQDLNTNLVSLFLIADVGNSGSGGSMEFETSCLPPTAYVSVQDDPGEFNGGPPSITGNWSWSGCCTDGGVIEDIGCSNTINLDLLVASGIDSIVWLTGDIANPDHILLSMSGEAITINCGGGICCPIGFDTDIIITDATCPDSPNGSIVLHPQDGVSPFSYDWSNGATTGTITGLLPGIYTVSITDAQGCSEELQITVDVSPGDPLAQSTELSLCSSSDEAVFDLTTIEDIINAGAGHTVLWYENVNLTISISDPSAYLSPTATIYAVVDNGSCQSDPVPVNLTVIQVPFASETTFNLCEESNGMATFDLTTLDQLVSSGVGLVSWYLDPDLMTQVPAPAGFLTGTTTVYAVVNDGICSSLPATVELIVDLKPIGFTTSMELCGDENDEAVFDLTAIETFVSGGNGSVQWYLEMELLDLITSPNAFQSSSTTVYAVVFDGICTSDAIPVDLLVNTTPVGIPVTIAACDVGSGMAIINLWDYASQVSGGAGGVEWFLDVLLTDPVPDPIEFYTSSTIIYAMIDNGTCVSAAVPVDINVLQSPVGNPTSLETCAEVSGQGIFNLTLIEPEVSGGFGTVMWFEDILGFDPIGMPSAYSSMGTTVYAQITANGCLSSFVPVSLVIINSVTANPASFSVCEYAPGIALFNLLDVDNMVSGGSGQVNWFLDPSGNVLIPFPDSFPSGNTTVYANVMAGTCVSGIVPVQLFVLTSPLANDLALDFCGDTNQMAIIQLTALDTLVSGDMGGVFWYMDSLLTTPIIVPDSFITSDTIIYAVVSNGACLSSPAGVSISVTAQLSANPVSLGYCVPIGDTLMIDLTQIDASVSGSGLQVLWFADSLATNEIINPDSFATDTSLTLFALITDGLCYSPAVPVSILVQTLPVANAFEVKKCGDVNGLTTVDLTLIESAVSNNSGTVFWYSDPALMNSLNNPDALVTADTVVFAVVTNGTCNSQVAPVTITVVDSLVANPQQIQVCVLDVDTATIDLTQYDILISDGGGPVLWFSDILATDTLQDASSFVTTGDTVYALVAADGCISDPAMISIEVVSSSTPSPICTYTSVDSIAISWLPVTDDYELSYTVNGQPGGTPFISQSPTFSIGNLGQSDTVTLFVTAMYNNICTVPLTSSVTCLTEVCDSVFIDFPGLDEAYCKDEPFVVINTNPPGGILSGEGISGDTLFPTLINGLGTTIEYTWSEPLSGCEYTITSPVQFVQPPTTPLPECQPSTLNSVMYTWEGTGFSFGFTFSINQGPLQGPYQTPGRFFRIDTLQEGDAVTLNLWSVGQPPCGNSDTVSITCVAKECPQASISFVAPDPICSANEPFQLGVNIIGLPGIPMVQWSGQGIADVIGIFDPALAAIGANTIEVAISEGGCNYDTTLILTVVPTPVAIFDIFGEPCIDSAIQIVYSGDILTDADFQWGFDSADVVGGALPFDFSIQWETPGVHAVTLQIDDQGCLSEVFEVPVVIDAPLVQPVINCIEEDYYSLVVGWEPVTGATQYQVTSSIGTGSLAGTTYTVSNLPDNTPVTIQVIAAGSSACGPSSAEIECQTLEYIPPQTYMPNIFSPNGDGINDLVFVQSNDRIIQVNAFRIFDRWGNVVFEDFNFLPNDAQHGWDGKFNGKLMNPAVFTYLAELQTIDQDQILITGDVSLVR